MPNPVNITNIPAPRVDFIDPRTGLMAREWYRFFFNLFNLTGAGTNDTSLADLQVGPPAITEVLGELGITYDQAQLASMMAQYEQSIRDVINQIETTPAFPQLGTMAQLQQAWLPWITFDNAPEFTPPTVGTVAWDGGTTLNVQMTPNVLGRVNESAYYYIKASSAITKGDVVMFTGAVGASGVPTGAPATGVTDGSYIMGVAAESIALNGFGLVQFAGTLKGLNTSAFADGDILWYDPAVTGGLTKTKPTAPNVKVQMAAVITAGSGGSGSILIRVNAGSVLGGTDSNVQFGTLADKDLIQYDSTAGYWKNVSPSVISIGTATNLSGGAAGSLPYQSAPNTTTFLSIGSSDTVLTSSGTAPQWTASTGTGNIVRATSPTLVTPALGTPTSGNFSTGTFTWPTFNQSTTGSAGSVANALTFNNSGTGAASGTTFNGSAAQTISYNTIGAQVAGTYVTAVTGTAPVVSSGGTTPAISMAAATGSVNGYLTSTDWTTFNNKQAALVSGTNIKTVSGVSLLGSGDLGIIGATYGGTGVNNGTRTLTVNTNSGTLSFTNASTTLTIANTASVSGTNTGDQTTITGNAGTATTLQTARTINQVSFNGSANITIPRVSAIDDRALAPADVSATYITAGFGSWANNSTSPFADYLVFRTYSDASGGNDNLLMFNKSALGMRLYQQTFGSATAFSSFKDIAWTDGTNATGNWTLGTLQVNATGSATTGAGQLYLNGATSNRIDFNANGVAAPTLTTRSAGTKILLYPNLSATTADYAFGVAGGVLWQTIPATTSFFRWYGAATQAMQLQGDGRLNVTSAVEIGGSAIGGEVIYAGGDINCTGYVFGNYVQATTGLSVGYSGTPLNAMEVTGTFSVGSPVTKTGNFTLAATENWVICAGTAAITVTLPAASTYPGRIISMKTRTAFAVNSASANVIPLATNTAGTAILAATAGAWATLVSNGTSWVIMQA